MRLTVIRLTLRPSLRAGRKIKSHLSIRQYTLQISRVGLKSWSPSREQFAALRERAGKCICACAPISVCDFAMLSLRFGIFYIDKCMLDLLQIERLARRGMTHIVNNDIGMQPGEFEDDRLSYPTIAAGDDRDLFFSGIAGSLDWGLPRDSSELKGRLPAMFEKGLSVEASKDFYQRRHHPGPPGLMTGADAGAV